MKAAVLTRFGKSADVFEIRKIPEPTCGPDDVLIAVRAASVNPVDVATRDGLTRLFQKIELPTVIGVDAAGVIAQVGERVNDFKVGDEVYTNTGPLHMNAFAELSVVPAVSVAHKPTSISFEEAASLPLVALTAWQSLESGDLGPGSKLFVSAGSGGVGTIAIQLGNHLGATVATTSSAKNHALLRELGADITIDYRSEKFWEQLNGYDLAIDMFGGRDLIRTVDILKPGGTVAALRSLDPDELIRNGMRVSWPIKQLLRLLNARPKRKARSTGTRLVPISAAPHGTDLVKIAKLVDAGAVRPIIDEVYPLDQIDKAFAHNAAGHTVGKVVVTL